jgi:heme/copper-type cytochrome/quinol oxidase subunit 1
MSSTELITWTIAIPTKLTYFNILCAIIFEKAKDFLSQIIGLKV